MKSLGSVKRGDTLAFTAALTDSATNAALTGATASLKCECKYTYSNDILAELTISETSTAGTYLFMASAATTQTWEAHSTVMFDIQYTDAAGTVSSTESFSILIEEDVTTNG